MQLQTFIPSCLSSPYDISLYLIPTNYPNHILNEEKIEPAIWRNHLHFPRILKHSFTCCKSLPVPKNIYVEFLNRGKIRSEVFLTRHHSLGNGVHLLKGQASIIVVVKGALEAAEYMHWRVQF